MDSLQKLINVSGQNNLVYQITVNDGSFDGGYNAIFTIACEIPGQLSLDDIENAVQGLASALSSPPAAELRGVVKLNVVETPVL